MATVVRLPAVERPDFQSVAPYDSTQRGEFLETVGALWESWDAEDERWLVVRKLIWAIKDHESRLDERLGQALIETVDAVENINCRSYFYAEDDWRGMFQDVRSAVVSLVQIVDDAEPALDALLGEAAR